MPNMFTLAIVVAMLPLFAILLAEAEIHSLARTIAAFLGPEPSPLMGLRPLLGSSGGRTCGRNGWVGVNAGGGRSRRRGNLGPTPHGSAWGNLPPQPP
jgi:hypothetical protein